MRSIVVALVLSSFAAGLAQAADVQGSGSGADQKAACKAARDNARGTSRKGIDFADCQCTQAAGKYTCTVKGTTR